MVIRKRVMNISKLNKTGFKNFTSLDLGIKKTVDWFNKNQKFMEDIIHLLKKYKR